MGRRHAVIGPDAPARADYALQIRLVDFSQVFSNRTLSDGVLDATATLADNADGRVIAQTDFHLRVAAPSADAAGDALALNRVSHEFATRVQA